MLEEMNPGLCCLRSICVASAEPHSLPYRKAAYPTNSMKRKFITEVRTNFSLLSWSPIALSAVTLIALLQADPIFRDQP